MKITKENILNMFNGSKLEFKSYFKFKFLYTCELKNIKINVYFGDGTSESIYRTDFTPVEIFNKSYIKEFDFSFKEIDNKIICTFEELY